jgi:hypothetical protein
MEQGEKEKLINAIVGVKDKIRDGYVLKEFYSEKGQKCYSREVYLNGQGAEVALPNTEKAHFYMFNDGNFKVYDPLLRQISYNMRADISALMKSKFIMFLEVFRFLYDFQNLSLNVRKTYNETFINKTR